MIDDEALARAEWRKSSFSGGGGMGGGNCVEVASLADGRIAVRNSRHPGNGVVLLARAEATAWIEGVKAENSTTSPDLFRPRRNQLDRVMTDPPPCGCDALWHA